MYFTIQSKKFTFSSYLRPKMFVYFLHPSVTLACDVKCKQTFLASNMKKRWIFCSVWWGSFKKWSLTNDYLDPNWWYPKIWTCILNLFYEIVEKEGVLTITAVPFSVCCIASFIVCNQFVSKLFKNPWVTNTTFLVSLWFLRNSKHWDVFELGKFLGSRKHSVLFSSSK